jgi:hypothetical protein
MVKHIFFVVTTCLLPAKFEERRREYENGIGALIREIGRYSEGGYGITSKILIMENNGPRETFLDGFAQKHPDLVRVIYTSHNSYPTTNKGLKEILDVMFVVDDGMGVAKGEGIGEDALIVKMTGRYRPGEDSVFIRSIYHEYDRYDAFVRTGAFMYPAQMICERDHYDCLTGIFACRAGALRKGLPKYIRGLKEYEWIEWVIIMIIQTAFPNDRIKLMDHLGLWMKTAYAAEYSLV